MNQAPAGRFDRYHTAMAHDALDLGVHDFEAGGNRICIEIAGAHPQAIKRHMFGLDYLLLEPSP
jgi:hypothetical protein